MYLWVLKDKGTNKIIHRKMLIFNRYTPLLISQI